jgi:hypothetical protein
MPSKTKKKLTTMTAARESARAFLAKRGLEMTDGSYTVVTPSEIARDNLKLSERNCAGLVLRYRDVKGDETDFYRFRFLEQPLPSGWDKLSGRQRAELRYSQPTGTAPRAYFPKKFKFDRFFQTLPRDRELTITEGEFKADAAARHAIACIGLGGVWNYLTKTEHGSELLPELARLPWAGMRVCICFDSDAAYNTDVLRARDGLCEQLEARGAVLFVRQLPQLKRGEKTGLDDYLLQEGAKKWHALPLERWYGPGVPRLEARPKDDFLKHKFAEREEILKSSAACLLRHPSIVQIHAYRGVGKTNVAMKLAGALARKDGEFLRWHAVRAIRVLYVEGEQPGADVQRIVKLQADAAPPENLHIMSLEDQPTFRFPKIVTPEGQAALERYIEEHRIEVLFLDSLSTLANVAMNEEENQLALGDWFVRLRTGLRVTVVYLQHDGKTGQQRGHSKHEDWIDLSIHLTWAGDYHGAEGLRAHFHIDKARQPIADGQDMRLTFGPSLKDPNRMEWNWAEVTKEEEKQAQILNAAAQMLFQDPQMSDRKLAEKLRSLGFKGSNDKLRKACEQARKLRAQGDAAEKTGKEGKARKTPKY